MAKSLSNNKSNKKVSLKSKHSKNTKKKETGYKSNYEAVIDRRLTIGTFSILYYFVIFFFMLAVFASLFSTNPNRNIGFDVFNFYLKLFLSYIAVIAISFYNLRTLAMARKIKKRPGIRGLFIYLSFIPAMIILFTVFFL